MSSADSSRTPSTPQSPTPGVGTTSGALGVRTTPVASEFVGDPQVLDLLEQYYADFATGDWDKVARHFWPNATIVTIRSPEFGAPPTVVCMRVEDYVLRHAASGVRLSALDIALESQRIERVGSVASAIAHYRAIDDSGDEAQSWRSADLFSLVLHDGEWRIASLVFEGARFGR